MKLDMEYKKKLENSTRQKNAHKPKPRREYFVEGVDDN